MEKIIVEEEFLDRETGTAIEAEGGFIILLDLQRDGDHSLGIRVIDGSLQ
jgi:hypothetical protein